MRTSRFMSSFLTIALVVSLFPVPAFAETSQQSQKDSLAIEENEHITPEQTPNASTKNDTSDGAAFYASRTTAHGVTVTIQADKGVFPKHTSVKVVDVAKESAQNRISNKVENVKDVAAVDITFFNEGKEVEPKGAVSVQLATQKEVGGAQHKVVHIKHNDQIEEIGNSSSTNAAFKANSFSIYAIVGTEKPETDKPVEKPTRTYEFYSDNNLVDTQILKNGEKLLEPSVPSVKGSVFTAWSNEDGSKFDGFGVINDITKKETIKLHAKYTKEVAVVFHNTAGEKIAVKVGKEGEKIKTDDVSFEVAAGNYITGWCRTPHGTKPVEKEISIGTEDIDLYPLVTGGNWLFFNGNEQDGNLVTKPVEPQFVQEGQNPKNPTVERRGYEFAGWYEDKECTKAFDFGKTLIENKEVFAKWTPKESSYTIKIWQQRTVDGQFVKDNYVVVNVKTVPAMSDSDITKAHAEKEATDYVKALMEKGDRRNAYDYYHFDFNAAKTDIVNSKVRGDENSVVNVYYDLHPYTIKFHKKNTVWANGALDENKYTAQMLVDGKPYDGESYLVKNYHVGEKIADKCPDVKATPKAGVTTEAVRTGWVNRNSGGGISNFLQFSDKNFVYIHQDVLVRETVAGFETINFYPVFPKDIRHITRFDYLETEEKGVYEVKKEEFRGPVTSSASYTHTGYMMLPINESYSKTINVREADGTVVSQTLPDRKTQVDTQTFYNVHSRKSYELVFFNNEKVEKSYKDADAIPYDATIEDKLYIPQRPSALSEFYTFKGWANQKGEIYNSEKLKKMPARNLHLYAQWEIKQVQVSFDSNGGTAIDSQVINAGEVAPKPKNPTREGLKFAGWVLPNGSPFNFSTRLTEDTKLVARWMGTNALTVTYDPKDGNGAPVDTNKYIDVSSIRVLGAPKVLPKDKFFRGWEFDGAVYYPGQFFLLKSQLAKKQANGDYAITFTARYTDASEKTKVVYDQNFGNGKTVEKEFINNDEVKISDIDALGFKVEDYEFVGWNTKADGTGLSYKVGDEVRVDNDLPLPNVLYAQWKKKPSNSITPSVSHENKAPNTSTSQPMKNSANLLPKTGDEAGFSLYAWGMLVSGSICTLLSMRRRKSLDLR